MLPTFDRRDYAIINPSVERTLKRGQTRHGIDPKLDLLEYTLPPRCARELSTCEGTIAWLGFHNPSSDQPASSSSLSPSNNPSSSSVPATGTRAMTAMSSPPLRPHVEPPPESMRPTEGEGNNAPPPPYAPEDPDPDSTRILQVQLDEAEATAASRGLGNVEPSTSVDPPPADADPPDWTAEPTPPMDCPTSPSQRAGTGTSANSHLETLVPAPSDPSGECDPGDVENLTEEERGAREARELDEAIRLSLAAEEERLQNVKSLSDAAEEERLAYEAAIRASLASAEEDSVRRTLYGEMEPEVGPLNARPSTSAPVPSSSLAHISHGRFAQVTRAFNAGIHKAQPPLPQDDALDEMYSRIEFGVPTLQTPSPPPPRKNEYRTSADQPPLFQSKNPFLTAEEQEWQQAMDAAAAANASPPKPSHAPQAQYDETTPPAVPARPTGWSSPDVPQTARPSRTPSFHVTNGALTPSPEGNAYMSHYIINPLYPSPSARPGNSQQHQLQQPSPPHQSPQPPQLQPPPQLQQPPQLQRPPQVQQPPQPPQRQPSSWQDVPSTSDHPPNSHHPQSPLLQPLPERTIARTLPRTPSVSVPVPPCRSRPGWPGWPGPPSPPLVSVTAPLCNGTADPRFLTTTEDRPFHPLLRPTGTPNAFPWPIAVDNMRRVSGTPVQIQDSDPDSDSSSEWGNTPEPSPVVGPMVPSAAQRTPSPAFIDAAGENALEMLVDYDTVFLIDDSISMVGQRWEQAKKAVMGVVAQAVKYQSAGVDCYFLNSKRIGKDLCEPADVEDIFAGLRLHGATPTGLRMRAILRDYMSRLDRSIAVGDENVRSMNLIVVTDGAFVRPFTARLHSLATDPSLDRVSLMDAAPMDDPESVLVNIAKRLDHGDFPLCQVGVQLLQVGDDAEAREALQALDDGLADIYDVRDMVDTVLYDGEELTSDLIVKVLLGGINRRLDRRG